MTRSARARTFLIAGAATALVLSSPASPAFSNTHDRHHDHDGDLRKVTDRLDGPRGVAALGSGRTLVTESDGTFSLVIERRHHRARTVELDKIATRFAPAVDVGPGGRVYLLTTGSDVGGARNAARLFQWRPGWRSPREVADIGAYQKHDKDPYDLERKPRESNPYGLEALDDGTVLVADAAGNDLLQVDRHGDIDTVARFKPRKVKVPSGLGTRDAEGRRLPASGTWVRSESVPTSVTEGDDGYWYVGELRGWPATPGTSQIWRIRPGSEDEVCDPRDPDDRDCKRYADGLTSIVDLAADEDDDTIYALSLSKKSWLRMEMGARGAKIGGLFAVERDDRHRSWDDGRDWDDDRRGRDGDRMSRWDDDRNRGWDDDRRWNDRCDHDDDWFDGRDGRDGRDNGFDGNDGRFVNGEFEDDGLLVFPDGRSDDGDRRSGDRNRWRDCDRWDDHHDRWDDRRDRWDDHHGWWDDRNGRWDDRRGDRWDDRCDWRRGDRHDDRHDDWGSDRRAFFDSDDDRRFFDSDDDERGFRGRDDDRRRDRDRDHCDDGFRTTIRELARNQLVLPGGVDVDDRSGDIYVVGPIFKRGALLKLDD